MTEVESTAAKNQAITNRTRKKKVLGKKVNEGHCLKGRSEKSSLTGIDHKKSRWGVLRGDLGSTSAKGSNRWDAF